MSFFVDTCVWSLAFRRDRPSSEPAALRLREAITRMETISTTGLVLQELLQGFSGPSARAGIIDRFSALPLIVPKREDHIGAAEIRNRCRRNGVQIGTIDALLAQLCIRHDLIMLTTDREFLHAARHCSIRIWTNEVADRSC